MKHRCSGVERHRLSLAMEEADRVPVAPSFLTRAMRKAGVRQYDYHTDPEVLAAAQIHHCEAYDFDGLFVSSDNVIMYEALGGRIVFHDEDSYPFWTDPLVSRSADLARLRVPDPARDGRMPVVIEAARIAARKVGAERFVLANIDSGPFQLAATIMGMDRAMTMLLDEPEELKRVLEFCTEVAVAYGKAMARSGCHGLQFGESSASVIGRAAYEEVVWPFDCRVIEELKQEPPYVFLHVCGDSTPLFDLLVRSGAHCLEIDSQVDMAWAKERAAARTALKGNICTTSFLRESTQELREECRQIVEAGRSGGGFILCGGCEVPADAPDESVRAVRRAAEEFGTYT